MKFCKHYIEEYDNIKVEMEPLFGNQLENIGKYIKKNSILSDLKIKNRLKEYLWKLRFNKTNY